MIRRISICLVLILVLSCTVVYLRDSDKNEIDMDGKQSIAPIDVKIDAQMNETQTKTKGEHHATPATK